MKNKLFHVCITAVVALSIHQAAAEGELTGDTRLACEAILCLSSSTTPSECAPSLSRYFSIHERKFSDTLKSRLNFLNLCPSSSQSPEMQSLVSAISNGAGRCTASDLNSTLRVWSGNWGDYNDVYISNEMPDYCLAYTGHSYTDFSSSGTLPRYVGIPQRKGYWVEARDYDQALSVYNEWIRQQDEKRRHNAWLDNQGR